MLAIIDKVKVCQRFVAANDPLELLVMLEESRWGKWPKSLTPMFLAPLGVRNTV